MAKTQAADEIEVNGERFTTNAVPDTYDLRDLEYRPLLPALPPRLWVDPTDPAFTVLTQRGQSCTGHAVAAVVNTVLVHQSERLRLPAPEPVSPYMLYRLARRYDEFAEEADLGSSLRGAFKGWLRHGIALDREWNALATAKGGDLVNTEIDLDEPDFVASCRLRPLGAYYRVNPYRLDDLQSAINELHAIAATAAIHSGWSRPIPIERPGPPAVRIEGQPAEPPVLWVIRRAAQPDPAGGHAFAIVGYNDLGFLVQNSWGPEWGDRGLAVLFYEDWLASAYDAWVVRPGVPNTPFATPASRSQVTTSGSVVTHGGPNLTVLRNYVVNTANDGRLSDHGRFTSTPNQLDAIFDNLAAKHAEWTSPDPATSDRHVLLYAHGGLVNEQGGLTVAERHLGFWLNAHVYPINFVWQSGGIETILDALADLTRLRLPAGGLGFDFEEQFDRAVESISRRLFGGLWSQMKGNAEGAAADGPDRGGTLVAERLRAYRDAHPESRLRIHLAGHSAGAIFLTALVPRLLATGLDVDSLALLGGAVRADTFAARVLPHVGGRVARFTAVNLSERAEQDDSCPAGPVTVYRKSLLYLVARGLEERGRGQPEAVPLVGLERSLDEPLNGGPATLRSELTRLGGRIVIAPSGATADLRSDARTHSALDDDAATLDAVLARMLERPASPAGGYLPNARIDDLPAAPSAGDQAAMAAAVTADMPGVDMVAEAEAAGARTEGATSRAAAHLAPIRVPTEAGIAPKSDSPILDVLLANGWRTLEPDA